MGYEIERLTYGKTIYGVWKAVPCGGCGAVVHLNARGLCVVCSGRFGRFSTHVRDYVLGREPDLDRAAIRTLFRVKGVSLTSRDPAVYLAAVKREFERLCPDDAVGYYTDDGKILIVWDSGAMLFQA